MIRLLRHDDSIHREDDGAVRFEDLASIFRSSPDMAKLLAERRRSKEKIPILLEPCLT